MNSYFANITDSLEINEKIENLTEVGNLEDYFEEKDWQQAVRRIEDACVEENR